MNDAPDPRDIAATKAQDKLSRLDGQVAAMRSVAVQAPSNGFAGDPRTIDVHLRWLRTKVEADPEHPAHLVTVRGHGYRFDPGLAVTQSLTEHKPGVHRRGRPSA